MSSINYKSSLVVPVRVEALLRNGRIISPTETPAGMVERVVNALYEQEKKFNNSYQLAHTYAQQLGALMDNKSIIMSTPILTNAGRYPNRPLSACIVPPVEITKDREEYVTREVTLMHEQGMGTGFNLDALTDPVKMLRFLNKLAVDGANSGREDRPVGNMAVLSIYHPAILEFIAAKLDSPTLNEPWKFNVSVDIDEAFFSALSRGEDVTLRDGRSIPAEDLFLAICSAAQQCADPGVVFLNRMNRRNPIPALGLYRTTAPCGEVGLVLGEACQFGYINLGNFVSRSRNGTVTLDTSGLIETTQLLTRFLDDALQISIERYSAPTSVSIMSQKRKIGVGICGAADAFSRVGYAYGSAHARALLKNALALINYASKEESLRLAEERGPCGAMAIDKGNRYFEEEGHLNTLYAQHSKDIATIQDYEWRKLDEHIRTTRRLRNITTTALPPTGRSALVVEASQGIEPHFSLVGIQANVKRQMARHIVAMSNGRLFEPEADIILEMGDIPDKLSPDAELRIRRFIATAQDIAPLDHLAMAAAAQAFTDEAVSKTVNLPQGSSLDDARFIYQMAWEQGLSGVTMYVDGTHTDQPKQLNPIKEQKVMTKQ